VERQSYFVGKYVAERFGYADPTNAMKQHCKGVVKRHPLARQSGPILIASLRRFEAWSLRAGVPEAWW